MAYRPGAQARDERVAKILIVDDGEHVSSLLIDLLDGAGYQTLHASEGKSALEMALRERPDLVLLDVMIPEMSGVDLLSALSEGVDLGGSRPLKPEHPPRRPTGPSAAGP